ncbi:MAG: hypothetical protein ACRED1_09730 [Limisphaerales bacterium]
MNKKSKDKNTALVTDLLLLPDGRILAQNLTQPMASLLVALNPFDNTIEPRARRAIKTDDELPNRA